MLNLLKIKIKIPSLFLNLVLPLFVLCAGLAITYQLWNAAISEAKQVLQQDFDFRAQAIETRIKSRIKIYSQLLHSARGLFSASHTVERAEFKTFVEALEIKKFYPGIQGLGFSIIVPATEKQQHLLFIQKQGFPQYQIRPAGDRDFFTSIIYLEPFDWRNQRAFGFDMYSEATRRAAMQLAEDKNETVLSGKVLLMQETDKNKQAGFLIYLPVYRNGTDVSNLEKRRANLLGWVYSPFRANDFVTGILEDFKTIDIELYDGEFVLPDQALFLSHAKIVEKHPPLFKKLKTISVAEHYWTLKIHSHPTFDTLLRLEQATFIAGTGISSSVLLSFIIWLMMNGRRRALRLAKIMTEALANSEERFRTLFNQAPIGIALVDSLTGHLYNANEKYAQIVGLTVAQLQNTNWMKITHPDDIQADLDNMALMNSGKINGFVMEKRYIHADGSTVWINLTVAKMLLKEHGHACHHCIVEDITERKQMEKTLRTSEARFRAIINASPIPIASNDNYGNVIFVNPAFIDIFGYDLNDIPTLTDWWSKAYPEPVYRQQVADGWQMALNKAESEHQSFAPQEVNICCKNAEIKTVIVNASAILGSFEYEHLVMLYDISDRKKIEIKLTQAKQVAENANRVKTEFLANMSHEIRTPMNAILGFSEILNNLITDPTHRYYLDAIHRSGKTLLQLINDILDLSKIEAGKFTLQYQPISIRTIVTDIQLIFSQKAAEKGIELSVFFDTQLPETLLLDEIRLRQVLLNLVGNAIKFTEHGFIKISVAVSFETAFGKINVCIKICDSGMGIPPAQQEKIFAAFTQQDNQSVQFGGTGLGLTISKRLAELMGGTLSVESEIGKGSCFSIQLNQVKILTDATKEKSVELITLPKKLHFQPTKILLVDDIAMNRQLIISYFAELPELTFIEAETGEQALSLVNQQQFDLILMDRRLPNMNGDEVCRYIKALPNYTTIPIIMISASILVIDKSQPHFYDLQLSKPVNKNKLLNAMLSFLPWGEIKQPILETTAQLIQASEKEIVNPELLALLIAHYQEMIKALSLSGVMQVDELIELAEELLKLAHQYHCTALQNWAMALKTQAELFDIANLQKTLQRFNKLVLT